MTSPSPRDLAKRRSAGQHHQVSAEDQALNIMAQEAESRLNTSQAVLAEARSIRSKELQRIRQETIDAEDDEDDSSSNKPKNSPGSQPETNSTPKKKSKSTKSTTKNRDKSKDLPQSMDDQINGNIPLKTQLIELDAKYKKVMMSNAQLDNEKLTAQYEIDLLKDKVDDLTEQQIELNRLLRIRNKELDEVRFELRDEKERSSLLEIDVRQRDELIKAHGLVFVPAVDRGSESLRTSDRGDIPVTSSSMLIPPDCVELLKGYEGSSLGEKVQKLLEEKQTVLAENKRLAHKLELESSRLALVQKYQADSVDGVTRSATGSDGSLQSDAAESQKNFMELKLKLKRAEQEITTLQGSVTRLESQANRYRTAAESSEKAEELLKQERKTLRTELRERQKQVEELSAENSHLMRRLERQKPSKNLTTES